MFTHKTTWFPSISRKAKTGHAFLLSTPLSFIMTGRQRLTMHVQSLSSTQTRHDQFNWQRQYCVHTACQASAAEQSVLAREFCVQQRVNWRRPRGHQRPQLVERLPSESATCTPNDTVTGSNLCSETELKSTAATEAATTVKTCFVASFHRCNTL